MKADSFQVVIRGCGRPLNAVEDEVSVGAGVRFFIRRQHRLLPMRNNGCLLRARSGHFLP